MSTKPEELKPIRNEDLYVEFDEDLGSYGVFGTESGFCYATYSDKSQADKYVAIRS